MAADCTRAIERDPVGRQAAPGHDKTARAETDGPVCQSLRAKRTSRSIPSAHSSNSATSAMRT
jgi:hypothetical protein